MQKTATLALLTILVACSGHSPENEPLSLYQLQTSCGNSARDWFSKIHGKDIAGTLESFQFGNHYNQKSRRCYLLWSETHSAWLSYQLIDVNENDAIGFYVQGVNEEKPTRCELEAKHCQSSKEWTELVTPYLHE